MCNFFSIDSTEELSKGFVVFRLEIYTKEEVHTVGFFEEIKKS